MTFFSCKLHICHLVLLEPNFYFSPFIMSRHIGGAQAMKCWEETIEKEELTRLGWYDKLSKGELDTSSKSKQYEVFKRRIELSGPTITEDFLKRLPKIPQRSQNRLITQYADLGSKSSRTRDFDEMRSVDPCVKRMLYDGFSKEEKGRYQYLKSRHLTIPERKYQFPLLSSWDYGWRLSDVIKVDDLKKPIHGRTKMVRDTFYTRNGVPTLEKPAFAKSYSVMF